MIHSITAVLLIGIVIGVFDALAATTLASFNGVPPSKVWQFVASGIRGPRAFEEGRKSSALGLFLHFVIALGVTSTFVIAAHFFPWLVASPFLTGATFGLLVFFVMQLIMRFSATPKRTMKPNQVLGQLAIHIFVIGIPIAVLTKHSLL
jgi:hypothetical protein